MKWIKLFVFLFLFCDFVFVNAWSWDLNQKKCEYEDKVKQCLEASKEWNNRTITDFVCVNWWEEKVLLQIILDAELKKIDKKVESDLSSMESNKTMFFWPEASWSVLKAIDDIEKKFSTSKGSFGEEYMSICNWWVISKALECRNYEKINLSPYFEESTCSNLVKTKLNIFKSISYNILTLNKSQVSNDLKKKNTQERRTKYDKLIDLLIVNIWYLERIWRKTPSLTKNTY